MALSSKGPSGACEVISSEIAEFRTQALLKAHVMGTMAGMTWVIIRWLTAMALGGMAAIAMGKHGRHQNVDDELRMAETQLRHEAKSSCQGVREAEDATRELLDLEAGNRLGPGLSGQWYLQNQQNNSVLVAGIALLESPSIKQLPRPRQPSASRESEMYAMQRRRLRQPCGDLRERSAECWASCRQVATELGEAEAALARRQAEENKTIQTQNSLEVQAMKRRLEEYDTAVDSLGNLMEDVARRVTKAVQHYEEGHNELQCWKMLDVDLMGERMVTDMEKLRGSEDANSGTASTAKLPSRNTDIIMRRIESMAHMLRAEALAQSQAFEAKLTSLEASNNAESKRHMGSRSKFSSPEKLC
eukprot:Skav229811  [mRNA]  locus=scaffold567:352479:363035:- [translate_table: standard]